MSRWKNSMIYANEKDFLNDLLNQNPNMVNFGRMRGYQRNARRRNEVILDNGLTVQQNALKKRYLTRMERGENGRLVGASRVSKNILAPVIAWLEENCVAYYFNRNEYGITVEGETFFYDLVIPSLELCVEFQGTNFHPSPRADWDKWKQVFTNKSAQEVADYDNRKAQLLKENRGYDTRYIWQDAPEEVDELLTHIKERYEVQQPLRNSNS